MSQGGGIIHIHNNSQVQVDTECANTADWHRRTAAALAALTLPPGATVEDMFNAIFDAVQACP